MGARTAQQGENYRIISRKQRNEYPDVLSLHLIRLVFLSFLLIIVISFFCFNRFSSFLASVSVLFTFLHF